MKTIYFILMINLMSRVSLAMNGKPVMDKKHHVSWRDNNLVKVEELKQRVIEKNQNCGICKKALVDWPNKITICSKEDENGKKTKHTFHTQCISEHREKHIGNFCCPALACNAQISLSKTGMLTFTKICCCLTTTKEEKDKKVKPILKAAFKAVETCRKDLENKEILLKRFAQEIELVKQNAQADLKQKDNQMSFCSKM